MLRLSFKKYAPTPFWKMAEGAKLSGA